MSLIKSNEELGSNLVGSWMVSVGDLDQALHLWEYRGGFDRIDAARKFLGQNQV